MSYSDYWENSILDYILTNGAYIALYTTTPNDAGGGVEVSGGGYVRQFVAGEDWDAAAGGEKVNSNQIGYPDATASWGEITTIVLHDAEEGGNMLAYDDLDASKTIGNTQVFIIGAGDLAVTLD